jgi:hypothetical protein
VAFHRRIRAAGDIGKFTDKRIEAAMDWTGTRAAPENAVIVPAPDAELPPELAEAHARAEAVLTKFVSFHEILNGTHTSIPAALAFERQLNMEIGLADHVITWDEFTAREAGEVRAGMKNVAPGWRRRKGPRSRPCCSRRSMWSRNGLCAIRTERPLRAEETGQ